MKNEDLLFGKIHYFFNVNCPGKNRGFTLSSHFGLWHMVKYGDQPNKINPKQMNYVQILYQLLLPIPQLELVTLGIQFRLVIPERASTNDSPRPNLW